jgi:hypothetical protein
MIFGNNYIEITPLNIYNETPQSSKLDKIAKGISQKIKGNVTDNQMKSKSFQMFIGIPQIIFDNVGVQRDYLI